MENNQCRQRFVPVALALTLFSLSSLFQAENGFAGNQSSLALNQADSEAAKDVVMTFTKAFDNLEWEPWVATMSEDCTMFFPFAPARANSREEILRVFKPLFERLRKTKESGPYLSLNPKQLMVQMLGEEAAVVTWHLDRAQNLGRRTAIVRKFNGTWLIVSFHASNFDKPTN